MSMVAIGEKKRVEVDALGPYLWLAIANAVGMPPAAFGRLTPRQARRIARELLELADVLDPPKEPKP